jgi:NADH/NAD ratio-sensing transcriptional regulator Rex
VKAILNYAPTSPQAQEGVRIRNIDPVISLQSMTYYLMEFEREENGHSAE